ncbi:MAG TPA: CUAEP/CCAEP-tail radical SAM protein [Anaeromyxobacteraceae bacterium]|nr:CUAEP/CCAEP-tail radical SAM protein [Anaeromyxobacteraceae bacterium]
MGDPGAILLVSTYELGHQPAGLATPKAFLERAGFAPAALDLAVEPLDPARVAAARLVVLSVPMHTALRLGLAAADRVRALNPSAALAFHGLYAVLHAPLLRERGAIAVLGGECEEALVALARRLDAGEGPPAVAALARPERLDYPVPSRAGLPPPERYARLATGDGTLRVAGHAEATRGCKHRCRHCPVVPVYGGRFFAVPVEVVREDVARQVASGVEHVTFGDPDFLNGPRHALRVAEALHAAFPALTFDFTAKVEHLVRQEALLPRLVACGAVFVVSAVESLSGRVLAVLDKGHSRGDVVRAFQACRDAGLALRPSLLPFTPWSTLDDYLDLLETFAARGWVESVDPVQLSIRLLVPPGSLLLAEPELRDAPLDPAALSHAWRHPDPRMDALQAKVARVAEEGATSGAAPGETFERVRRLALAAAGRPHEHVGAVAADAGRRSPRLTESWFC